MKSTKINENQCKSMKTNETYEKQWEPLEINKLCAVIPV